MKWHSTVFTKIICVLWYSYVRLKKVQVFQDTELSTCAYVIRTNWTTESYKHWFIFYNNFQPHISANRVKIYNKINGTRLRWKYLFWELEEDKYIENVIVKCRHQIQYNYHLYCCDCNWMQQTNSAKKCCRK